MAVRVDHFVVCVMAGRERLTLRTVGPSTVAQAVLCAIRSADGAIVFQE